MSKISRIVTGSVTATGAIATMSRGSRQSYSIQVTGTFVGTIVAEGSVDGTTYAALPLRLSDGTFAASATTTGIYRVEDTGAVPYFRVRCSAYTSGTITAKVAGEQG